MPLLDFGHGASKPRKGCDYQVYLSLYWEDKLKARIEVDYIQYLSDIKDGKTPDQFITYMNRRAAALLSKETDEVKVEVNQYCLHCSPLASGSGDGADVGTPQDGRSAAESEQLHKAAQMNG